MKVKAHKCRNASHPFPLFAWLIMLFQGMMPWKEDSYAHMALSFNGNFYDVTKDGCKKHRNEDFLKKYKIVGSHEFSVDITEKQFERFFQEHEDKKYDVIQIVGLALKLIGIITFNTLGSDLRRLICNELIIDYLGDFHGFQYKDSDNFDLINTWNKVKEY